MDNTKQQSPASRISNARSRHDKGRQEHTRMNNDGKTANEDRSPAGNNPVIKKETQPPGKK